MFEEIDMYTLALKHYIEPISMYNFCFDISIKN